jgi:predicted AlkP superfamily pyrophosphatase or phosphodiesterase
VVYIDDLAIYSDSEEEHLEHLEKVFIKMRENQVYAKWKKCFFMQQKAHYLGHIIGPDGISMDPAKIETITKWPEIKSIKQLQAFLGLVGYY